MSLQSPLVVNKRRGKPKENHSSATSNNHFGSKTSSSSKRHCGEPEEGFVAEEQLGLLMATLRREEDGSDLENSVSRLCQYLSGSDVEDASIQSTAPSQKAKLRKKRKPSRNSSGTHLPEAHKHWQPVDQSVNQLRNSRHSTGLVAQYSVTGNIAYRHSSSNGSSNEASPSTSPSTIPIEGSPLKTSSPTLMDAQDSFHPPPTSYHRRMGKPVLPQDFLNIPPPAHPPDASPTLDHRPLPPQRQLPPVPTNNKQVDQEFEEPQYEEAKPPPPAPRPSKQKSGSYKSLPRSGVPVGHGVVGNGYELSASQINASHKLPQAPIYMSQQNSTIHHYHQENDWPQFPMQLLERNPDTGSFYIPSGHTTMSSLSPQSQKMEMMAQNKHNYTLLPGSEAPGPQPVMQMRPEMTVGMLNNSVGGGMVPPRHKSTKKLDSFWHRCSWKCLAYGLTVILIFSLAVICYLLVSLLSASPAPRVYYHGKSFYGEKDSGRTEIPEGYPLRPLPESFSLGDPVVADLPPGVLAYTYFTVQRDSYVQVNLSISPRTKLVVYGRQTLVPTPSENDFSEVILGEKLHAQPNAVMIASRKKRAIHNNYGYSEQNLRTTVFVHYLLAGRWHLGFLNDGLSLEAIRFTAALSPHPGENDCKYGCHGKGICKDGKCYCFEGYTGAYCEESVCPILCSGNGIFTGGGCHCHQGWKGPDCDIPASVCEVPSCNGHGHCGNHGDCLCDEGWEGQYCVDKSCPRANCSGHGICASGICYCEFGWKGMGCENPFTLDGLCPGTSDCSGHGRWNHGLGRCDCDVSWSGELCENELCNLECGVHGYCSDGSCVCDAGWTGSNCNSLSCLPGCEEHGSCNNGTCKCEEGWNGENCQLEGCKNRCNRHGTCRKLGANWRCDCSIDFSGFDCTIPIELDCSDGLDNDEDGLTDCEDSECCATSGCRDNPLCESVPNPYTVLLGEQPPPPQASFYQKMKFLLEPNSVQKYPDVSLFNESRATVIRGRVVNEKGGAVTGVRVTDRDHALLGFTLTRGGGMFDVVVNGGGSVTLQFMRRPFLPIYKTITAPWNRIVRTEDIVMFKKEEDIPVVPSVPVLDSECVDVQKEHSFYPSVRSSWEVTKFGGGIHQPTSSSGVLVADSKAVQENLRLPGTKDLFLSYFSANAPGYESSLELHLVGERASELLRLVHVRIDIEGNHFQKTLEAKPNLTYSYGWDRRNIYKQKVYGLTVAKVGVGYVYSGCSHVFWEWKEVKLNGFKSGGFDVGGWNLNIHHHYDILDGILERGDGSVVYMREELPVVTTVIGNERQRSLNCPFCNSITSRASLFQPVALASAPDGAIYLGDHNLIRRLSPNNTVTTVLELSPSDTAHQYYMAVDPVRGHLYISLPLRRQIWRVDGTMSASIPSPTSNFQVVIGTGQPCVFGERCGDGGPAEMARLTFPKGIAFDSQGSLFIADERRIRHMSPDGQLTTVLGGESVGEKEWRPLPCTESFQAQDLPLQWPTHLIVEPLSDRLLILDSDMVFRVDSAEVVRVVVGSPPHCSHLTDALNDTFRPSTLHQATSIAIDSLGRILVSESDRKRMHRIRAFDPHHIKSPELVAGKESKCDCHPKHCPCDDEEYVLARDAHLHVPIALAVDPKGIIYVADQGNLKIRAIRPSLPQWKSERRQYEIYSPNSKEVYVFNRFGQHLSTKSLLTGSHTFNFSYHIDTAYGRLIHVTGSGGHKLYFLRKTTREVHIETANGVKSIARLSLGRPVMLESLEAPDGATTRFDYDANTGLLVSRRNPDNQCHFYDYNDNGHATATVLPTGDVYRVEDRLRNELDISVTRNQELSSHFTTSAMEISQTEGIERVVVMVNGGVHLNYPGGWRLQTDTSTHSLLLPYHSAFLKQKLQIPAITRPSRIELGSRMEWRYYLRREALRTASSEEKLGGRRKRVVQVGRKTRVNGLNVLTVEYDRVKRTDTILDRNNEHVLTVHYASTGLVTQWKPSFPDRAVMNISYGTEGRMDGISWGVRHSHFGYDGRGRLIHFFRGSVHTPTLNTKYTYEENRLTWPSSVVMPSGSTYQLSYDGQGALDKVLTPEGWVHKFQTLPEMGVILTLRSIPGLSLPFVLAKNDVGLMLRFATPNAMRRASFQYTPSGKIERILYGDSNTGFEYNTDGLVSRTTYKTREVRGEDSVVRQGPLVVERDIKYTVSATKLNTAIRFGFTYDDLLRVTSVQAHLNEAEALEPTQIQYQPGTGRIERLKNFNFQYSPSKARIMGENYVAEIILGHHNEITRTRLVIRGRKVSEQNIDYDKVGRVVSIMDESANSDLKWTFNEDGHLSELSVGEDSHKWKLEYNADGGLKSMNSDAVNIVRGIVKDVGKLAYVTDSAGSTIRRGVEEFAYDAFGRLIRARQDGVYDVIYGYDVNNRLIVREDVMKRRLMAFYYTSVEKPGLVTHVYDSVDDGVLISFHYDTADRLFALEKAGNRYYVVTLPDGSPVSVFSEDGGLVRSILRGPYGRILQDSDPNFYLPVGWRGSFQEFETDLSLFDGRAMDPFSGRWMSITLDSLQATPNPYRPFSVDLFNFDCNWESRNDHSMDITKWLSLSGIEVGRVLPLLDMNELSFQDPVRLGSVGELEYQMSSFHRFLTDTPSPVLPATPFPSLTHLRFSASPSVYGDGVALARHVFDPSAISGKTPPTEMAVVYASEGANKFLQDAMLILLNESLILPLEEFGWRPSYAGGEKGSLSTNVVGERMVISRHYFWKPNTLSAKTDLESLGVKGNQASLTRTLNLTLLDSLGSWKSSEEQGMLVSVESEWAEILIHYGGSVEEVGKLYRSMLKETTEDILWREEQLIALTNSTILSRQGWNPAELQELKSNGRISPFVSKYRSEVLTEWSNEDFSLISDPSALQLYRKELKAVIR